MIKRGPIQAAIGAVIYGTEGVGKTTFASQADGAVFIDTEGSTTHMDVARFDPPEKLADVITDIQYAAAHPAEVGTLVIDTVDSLEKLIFRAVCEEKGIKNIEDLGYGKGYTYAKQKMQALLEDLDKVKAAGVHVILVCHSMIRKFELPDEMGSYDRYMLKLNEKNIAPLVKEWADLLLFVNYRTDIITDSDGKTKKGKGGQKRIMYANHSACWDAKNRFGLPDELPFDFAQVAHLFRPVGAQTAPAQEEPKEPEKAPEKAPEAAPVAVEVSDTMPLNPPKKSAKKQPEAPKERPESMRSDDPEKDKLLDALWKKMIVSKVPDPLVVQAVVAEKDYYDVMVQLKDYDKEFISDVLIEAWEQVNNLCQTKIHDLPF